MRQCKNRCAMFSASEALASKAPPAADAATFIMIRTIRLTYNAVPDALRSCCPSGRRRTAALERSPPLAATTTLPAAP
eukprot:364410-Chlamydomonas_euryale.AAC.9